MRCYGTSAAGLPVLAGDFPDVDGERLLVDREFTAFAPRLADPLGDLLARRVVDVDDGNQTIDLLRDKSVVHRRAGRFACVALAPIFPGQRPTDFQPRPAFRIPQTDMAEERL